MDGWKLVPVEPEEAMTKAGMRWLTGFQHMRANDKRNALNEAFKAMLAAATTPPNPIACHVDEICGQGGGEVEVLGYCIYWPDEPELGRYYGEEPNNGARNIELVDRAHVTRLQAERDALKAQLLQEREVSKAYIASDGARSLREHSLQSRLAQATAIIDYVEQHIELDAILAVDIPAFREGAAPKPTGEVADLKAEVERLTAINKRLGEDMNDQTGPTAFGEPVFPKANYFDNVRKFLETECAKDNARLETERDALKTEVARLRGEWADESAEHRITQVNRDTWRSNYHQAQSRLAQATAIIDYLWLHTELDAIAKPDVDRFYAGSTDAEKAARAEMVRVANEPAEGGL